MTMTVTQKLFSYFEGSVDFTLTADTLKAIIELTALETYALIESNPQSPSSLFENLGISKEQYLDAKLGWKPIAKEQGASQASASDDVRLQLLELELAQAQRDLEHWKANHADVKRRLYLATHRTDIREVSVVVSRLKWYEDLMAESRQLKAHVQRQALLLENTNTSYKKPSEQEGKRIRIVLDGFLFYPAGLIAETCNQHSDVPFIDRFCSIFGGIKNFIRRSSVEGLDSYIFISSSGHEDFPFNDTIVLKNSEKPILKDCNETQ
jgi:hypothetical protein